MLIVEDNDMWRKILVTWFSPRYDVHAVSTVAEALPRLDHTDLMILDMRLPNGEGGDVIRSIRKESAIPIIACTGYSEEFRPKVRYPWIEWVDKPIGLDALETKLAETIERVAKEAEPYATGVRNLREWLDRGDEQ